MSTTANVEAGRNNVLRLADGRMLGYAEYGDPLGTPVIAFHGTPGSRISGGAAAHKAAARHGVRLVAPDRPGMGLSSFQPHRRVIDWPDDVVELADALDIERFGVMGVSGGGPYVAACAFKIPQRVTGAAIVSGLAPMDRDGATDGMNRMNKLGLTMQRRVPIAGRAMISVMAIAVRRNSEGTFDRMISGMAASDQEIARRPEMRAMFLEDIAEAFLNGARGPALENGLHTKPWGFRLQDITIPVHLWQGGADLNVPEAHARSQALAISGSILHFFPDEGHLLFVDRIDEILTAITNDRSLSSPPTGRGAG